MMEARPLCLHACENAVVLVWLWLEVWFQRNGSLCESAGKFAITEKEQTAHHPTLIPEQNLKTQRGEDFSVVSMGTVALLQNASFCVPRFLRLPRHISSVMFYRLFVRSWSIMSGGAFSAVLTNLIAHVHPDSDEFVQVDVEQKSVASSMNVPVGYAGGREAFPLWWVEEEKGWCGYVCLKCVFYILWLGFLQL